MERLVNTGHIKSIGVSNFNQEQLANIVEHCSIKPAVNQVDNHLYNVHSCIIFSYRNNVFLSQRRVF